MIKANLVIWAISIFLVVLLVPAVNSFVNNPYSGNKEVSEKDVLDLINSIIRDNVVFEEEKGNEVFVEPAIYEELEKNGNAPVIVWLKRDLYSYDIDKIKERVKENQDLVLDDLKNAGNNRVVFDETILSELSYKEINDSNEEENFRLVYRYEVSNGFAGIITKKGLDILSKHELVESVYGEKFLHTGLAESVPLINADKVWTIQTNSGNTTGTGQTVCVVDTGIDYNHPALGGCLGTGCKVKGGWDFINNDSDPVDDQGHGTHVAGIAAANGNIKGVAPGAELIAVKVCDNTGLPGSCPASAMIAGVDYCVANLNTLGTDIITMSLGDGGEYGPNSLVCPQWMNPNLALATHLGIPITVSSGNDVHNNGISYPACSPNVISVGATYDSNFTGSMAWNGCTDLNPRVDNVTCFSNTGSNLDVMAPGAVITSTASSVGSRCGAPNPQGLGNCSGTSMAAPHVAGTIALLKQMIPSLTPFQLERVLKLTGNPVTDPQNGLTFPRIDALRAVTYENISISWGNDMRLTFDVDDSLFPSLATDSQGNVHIAWQDHRDGYDEIYYKKLDNNGNTLVNDTRMTFTNIGSRFPSLAVDTQGNVHIAWQDHRNWNIEVYYTKLDNNGNTLINDTRMTFSNIASLLPSLGVDTQGNVHISFEIFFVGGSIEIHYIKLDNNGNTLVNDTRLTSAFWFPAHNSLGVDTQGNVHIAWQNSEIFYTKLDNNGNTLVDDTRLTFNGLFNYHAVTPSLGVDTQGNVHIAWRDNINGNDDIYYTKLDNNGNTSVEDTRLTFNNPIYNSHSITPFLAVDTQGNVHIAWSDSRQNYYYQIYYTKLDNNGNTLVNDTGLTFNPASSSLPSLSIDSQDNVHVAWVDRRDGNREIYYKRSLFSSNQNILSSVRLVGTPAPGSTVSLQLNSPLNANQNYIFGLALGTSPGFNLGNHHIPLNPDFLLSATFTNPSSAGLSNSMGTLNANGQATVTLAVPNLPWLSGWTVYGGFITFDAQGQISGISDPVRIDIV